MARASKGLPPPTRGRNALRPTGLSEHECAATLLALLGGAKQIPEIKALRAVVLRAASARVIILKGRRRHG